MRHHLSTVFFRRGRTPLNAGVGDLELILSLSSALPMVGEPNEDGDEERLGVEDRERECDMLLGTLESVVRAERATERRLLVSPRSGLGEWPRGADVGPLLGLERPLGTTRRESLGGCGWGVDSEEDRDTRDDVRGVAADGEGDKSSGVDGELVWSGGRWRAESWGVDRVDNTGVPDLL